MIHTNGLAKELVEAFRQGAMPHVFDIIEPLAMQSVAGAKDKEILSRFFFEIRAIQYIPARVQILQDIFKKSEFPELLLGNSALLVFRKNVPQVFATFPEEERNQMSRKLLNLAHKDGIERCAISAIIKNKKGEILLLRRANEAHFTGLYEFPGGGMERNEDIFLSLAREVYEETGRAINEIDSQVKQIDFFDTDKRKCRRFFFNVTLDEDEIILEPEEHDEYIWVNRGQVAALPMFAEIRKELENAFREPEKE